MMNAIRSTIFVFLLLTVSLKAAECEWAIRAGGEGNDKIRGISADTDGAFFVTGEFSEGADFGGFQLSCGGALDFVVAKIDVNGRVLWASAAGGEGIDRGYSVSPAGDGGCFVTGHFQSEKIQFGATELISAGDYDGFVARLDSHGEFAWAIRFGGAGYDFGHGIATTTDGSIVLSATVADTGDFGSEAIGGEKRRSAVLAKLTPLGKVEWLRTASGPSISGHCVAAGPDGSVYLGGLARGEIAWTDSVTTESAVQDICVAKYDSAGNFQWVKTGGGESDGVVTGVSVDPESGNVCIVGMFEGTVAFAREKETSKGGHDFYAAVYSPEGAVLGFRTGGGAGTDYALAATALPGGGFAFTGEATGHIEIDGKSYSGSGERDVYIATIDGDGKTVTSFDLAGGPDHDLSYAVAAIPDGSICISGAFRTETKLGEHVLKSKKGNDIFVAKFSSQ